MITGQVGTYKVAYLKPSESGVLYSRMFDKIEAALDFGHALKGRWMLFQKDGMNEADYSWKLLPYGDHKAYSRAMFIDSIWWAVLAIAVFIAVWWVMKFFKRAGSIPGVQ